MVGQLKKAYLHSPIEIILYFLLPATIQKCSKYFSFFNNKPTASWVAHIRDFLTCYSFSYYSSMFPINIATTFWRGKTSNQRWNNVLYFNVDMNVRQRRSNVLIFNVEFRKGSQCWNNIVKRNTFKKKNNTNKKIISNWTQWVQSFNSIS